MTLATSLPTTVQIATVTVAVHTEDTTLYVALFIHATTTCLMTTVRRTATFDPAVNMLKTFDPSIAIRDGCPLQ